MEGFTEERAFDLALKDGEMFLISGYEVGGCQTVERAQAEV